MSHVMPKAKAAEALGITTSLPDPSALLSGLNAHACHLLKDQTYDVDRFVRVSDPDPMAFVFRGFWGSIPRFEAGVQSDGSGEGQLVLGATHGPTPVDLRAQLGRTGLGIGNPQLVAAALHIALFYLRACGMTTLVADPVDARLRRKYALMGFDQGAPMRLLLNDPIVLEKAFGYVDGLYGLAVPPLSLRRAPLPL
jgi:hypothetical protein